MFQEPLTAEFALVQLEALANDEDIWDVNSFNEYVSEDERENYKESPSSYFLEFLGILISCNWSSLEEFLEFYKAIGLEAFESASNSGEVFIFDIFVSSEILSFGNLFNLYKNAILLAEKSSGKEYSVTSGTPSKLFQSVDLSESCNAYNKEIPLILLIPGAAAYTWNHHWEDLSNNSGNFSKVQIDFYCDIISCLGSGYREDGREELAVIDIAKFSRQSSILEELFELQWNDAIYDFEFTNYLCENESTSSEILQAITFAAIEDFEQLESNCGNICETDALEESAENWADDEKTLLCHKILQNLNCTDNIREIIEKHLAE